MSDKTPESTAKVETQPTVPKAEKPNAFKETFGRIGNGMKEFGKSVLRAVGAAAEIPFGIIRGVDRGLSGIPIVGDVYGAGKGIIGATWGMTEQVPLLGAIPRGLREGATKVADKTFTPEQLRQIGLAQEGFQRTPNDLQVILDNASGIGGDKRDILQNMIEINKTKGTTVSKEDYDIFMRMIDDASKKQEYAGGFMLGSLAEASWDVPGGKTSDWIDSSGQRQTTQFSSHPLSGDEYSTLISSNPKFPAPAYEALSDRQKRFLDTCKTQICPEGSPTKEQKELIGAMAYVSEAFGKNETESVVLMNARMQEVQNTYRNTMPDNFKNMFDQALSRGRNTNVPLAKEGH